VSDSETYNAGWEMGRKQGLREAAAEIERLRATLESLTKDPPASLAREPDEDWEVIIKMRAIARAALEPKP
jgi:hypothetical protein